MSKKQRLQILGVVAVLCGLAAGWYLHAERRGTQHAEGTRQPAMDFALPDSAGRAHALHDLKGNVVILHFWASWCPPCVGEIPQLVELAREFQGKPLKILAVSQDDRWSDADKVLMEKGLPDDVISVIDLQHALPAKYGTYQYPETYLLDRDLNIVAKLVGPQQWQNPNLEKVLLHLMGKTGGNS